MPVVDVRDVAAVHAAALRPGRGPRRYLATSELVPLVDMMRIIAEAGGRKPPRGTVPAPLLLALARAMDRLQRLVSKRLSIDYQSIWTAIQSPQCDASATVRDLGVEFRRPAAESLRDAVHWLSQGGGGAGRES